MFCQVVVKAQIVSTTLIEAEGTDSGGMQRQGGDPMKSGSALVRSGAAGLRPRAPRGAAARLTGAKAPRRLH
ncbi:hypothetical protein D1B31_00500 [Neobacillus notoginsengisoli]|uniref:Uncharacterized protein n=1 Tax=Neobacillus notoginsengisoli TaxID=1578198 RepID=A0A417YZT8_9BACI|nr:hypothetical protein D1B31_00500 [Neobacillus notoginsengisoli]